MALLPALVAEGRLRDTAALLAYAVRLSLQALLAGALQASCRQQSLQTPVDQDSTHMRTHTPQVCHSANQPAQETELCPL